MKNLYLLLFAALLAGNTFAQTKISQLKVADNGHYLTNNAGEPVFWLGDTGWELFHLLKYDEINKYLENRRTKGFNVIQAVILSEFNGLRVPNAYGDLPLIDMDPTKPNEKYFAMVDSVVRMALRKNLYMGLLPTWGDKVIKAWGNGPIVFTPENAYVYGKYLGNRYKKFPNIVWIFGGDRGTERDGQDVKPVWRAMAKGINEATNDKAFITYHPWGGDKGSSFYIHNEPWLDMNMVQSGHGSGHDVPVWEYMVRDWNLSPAKPTLDAEPNYEDHPVNPWPKWDPANGYFNDYDVRKQCYRSVFAGACGVTYGHHSVWSFAAPSREKINHAIYNWPEAIDRPGAFQMGYLRRLIESRPQLSRVYAPKLILAGQGTAGEFMTATSGDNGQYIMVYLPVGKAVSIDASKIQAKTVNVCWFNPRNGTASAAMTLKKASMMQFTPPDTGLAHDWVLIIDNPDKKYQTIQIKN